LSLFGQKPALQSASSWEQLLNKGEGKVIFYWYPQNLKYLESKDIIDGVEHELAVSFIDYLEKTYEVSIDHEWVLAKSFNGVLQTVSTSQGGVFGASSISITPERREILSFTPSYLPDIAVLVSSGNMPIARSNEEFLKVFGDKVAVTIPNTTLERKLLVLKNTQGLDFEISFVGNSGQIIERIEEMETGFGYVDLPNFLIAFEESKNIRRQFFYPLKLDGLSMVYPLDGDWSVPVNEYFESHQYQEDKERILSKFLGDDMLRLIDQISKSAEIGPYEEIIIRTQENELQYKELLSAARKAQEEQGVRNLLIGGLVLLLLLVLALYMRFHLKTKANLALAEKQLLIETRNEQLFGMNAEKNNLIKILAHDLRAPIAQIIGFSRLVKESDQLTPDEKEMLGYIEHSSDHLRMMISKILDVDAIESGKRNVTIEKVNAKDIIKKVIEDQTQMAQKKNIQLLDISDDPNLTVLADEVYLIQIIENLVSNALKFSSKETSVRLNLSEESNEVIFSVEDEGPGFTAEDEQNIFTKYKHLSAKPTAGEPSTGLGLSIVKNYTEMMNGKISYKTTPKKGTTFFITLPKAG